MEEEKLETNSEPVVNNPEVVTTVEPVTEAVAPESAPVVETPVVETPVVEKPVVETPAAPAEPIASVEPTPAVEPAQPAETAPSTAPPKKSKSGLIIIILLVLVLGGFAVWYFVLGGNGSKKEEPKKEPEQKENNPVDEKEPEQKEDNPVDEKEKYRKISSTEMKEIFDNTFGKNEERDYLLFYKNAQGIETVYNNVYASFFSNNKVEFSSLLKNDNQKYEISHVAAGYNVLGKYKTDKLKKSYETIFGGNSFIAKDYTLDDYFNCKVTNDDIECTAMETGGLASAEGVAIKYISGSQNDDELTLMVYGLSCVGDEVYDVDGNKIEGITLNNAFNNEDKLSNAKYKVTYKIDDVGTTLVSAEPIK